MSKHNKSKKIMRNESKLILFSKSRKICHRRKKRYESATISYSEEIQEKFQEKIDGERQKTRISIETLPKEQLFLMDIMYKKSCSFGSVPFEIRIFCLSPSKCSLVYF